MSKTRSTLYRAARVLGDVEAIGSGKPDRMLRRLANKWLGRNVVRRVWR